MFIWVLLTSPVEQTFISKSVKASPAVLCSNLSVFKLHRISIREATITVHGELVFLCCVKYTVVSITQLITHSNIAVSCQVYNVRYIVNMNGEAREGALEIDSDNNLERFRTGSGAEEAVEIHGFQIVSDFVLVLSSVETFCVLSKEAKP